MIVGNGIDLYHGLKTLFRDFIKGSEISKETLQGLGLNGEVFAPNLENATKYAKFYEIYQKIYPQTKVICEREKD